jgi:hypothetical protein
MIAFLNERSLGQYGDWSAALKFFLRAAQELSNNATLFKDTNFFSQGDFAAKFNTLGLPSDVRGLIRELSFGSRYYRCWRPGRLSDNAETYSCAQPVLPQLQDESICEAAERRLLDASTAISLLSASDSTFTANQIALSKTSTQEAVSVANAIDLDAVRRWLAAQPGQYNRTSTGAPRDFQTILGKAPQRFQPTGRVEPRFSRKIFREVATSHLFYVDDGHPGHSAHLEVFSATLDHVGTADIETGAIDQNTAVQGRKLRF